MKRRFSAVLAALLLLTALLPAAAAFSDVPYDHWASSYINRANAKGWVSGTGNDCYTPGRSVTAAEFFTMIANAFFPEEMAAQPRGEVWYTPAWNLAQTLNLQKGTIIQSKEQLTVPLSRQDMAQIICNTLSAKGLPLPSSGGQTFADWADIPSTYHSAISSAAALGILNGKGNGAFAPLDSLTRAEAAAVLCRMSEALYPIEVIRLVNVERAKEGLVPLSLDLDLMAAAQIRAVEIGEKFSHTRPNGQACLMVLWDVGVDPYSLTRSGENIASGFGSPESVVNGWMNSPGHRANILDKGYRIIGVGHDGNRWVQIFGRTE